MRWIYLSSMLPFWRYWPVYLLFFLIFLGLFWTWVEYVSGPLSKEMSGIQSLGTSPILFAGVAVAALAIIANTWSHWQTARISGALQGLQTLRTHREYLINMAVVRKATADLDSNGGKLTQKLIDEFLDPKNVSADVDTPTFRDASLFVLNQYEFLAASARSGAFDLVLLRSTLRGPIEELLTPYAEAIVKMRKVNPRAFSDLIWLHHIMSGERKPYLGPIVSRT